MSSPEALGSGLPDDAGEFRPASSPNPALTSGNVLPGETGETPGDPPSPLPRSIGRGAWGEGCIRGDRARIEWRVLPGRHQDGCEDPDACSGCELCPEPHCQVCRRNHATTTCPTCLAMARTNLDAVACLVEELPYQAINGRQAFHQHHGIPGGDALVMLTPASPRREGGQLRPVYAEPGDPRPPLDVLAYWVNRWADHQDQALQLHPTMSNTLSLLDGQLHRIADTHLFVHLARDLARVRVSLENVLHAGVRPDLSRVPCLSCGTRLVKVWADQEARDHWRCPSCWELYDQGRYERAKHDQLASRGADRFVPISDAIAVTGRPEQTVRAWMRQGLVAVRRDPAGRLLVWWPDVRDKHRATPTRKRKPRS